MYQGTFTSNEGPVSVGFAPGSITLVAGPNGVGKSALLFELYRSIPQGVGTYLPGHRQINFNQGIEQLGQDAAQLSQNAYTHFEAFNRYKGAWSEDQFKSAIRTLMHAESAFNRSFRQDVAIGNERAVRTASLKESPIDTLNLIFRNAGLPVTFNLTNIGLTAEREGSQYGVDALSDGERASLFIAAAFITQPAGAVLLIDEPEKHLHPSITGILLETALRAKPDIAVVLSSHDITLLEQLNVQSTIYVQNSAIIGLRPEIRVYTVELISEGAIPDSLKADVLGARSKILFVEGTDRSRDGALYSHMYPGRKVLSKGSADKVMEAVGGIKGSSDLHWVSVVGLIDRDGRSIAEINTLDKRGIMTLPTPTIENLFFVKEMQKCFVVADLKMRAGPAWEDRQQALALTVRQAAVAAREEIVARRVCWLAQREISSHPLSVKDVREGIATDLTVSIQPIKDAIMAEVDAILDSGDIGQLLLELPIKNTDVPDAAARALGASSFKEYCAVIQRQLDLESEEGVAAREVLRAMLPSPSGDGEIATPKVHVAGPRLIGIL